MATRRVTRQGLRRPPPQDAATSLARVEEHTERAVDSVLAGMATRIRDRVRMLDQGGAPVTPAQAQTIRRIIDEEFRNVYGSNPRQMSPMRATIEASIIRARQVAVDPTVRRLSRAIHTDPELAEYLNVPDLEQG
jgi:hypothetical protein